MDSENENKTKVFSVGPNIVVYKYKYSISMLSMDVMFVSCIFISVCHLKIKQKLNSYMY